MNVNKWNGWLNFYQGAPFSHDIFQSQITWADYSSRTVNEDDDIIDIELLTKKYADNVEKGQHIEKLSALKFDIRAIRADIANFCFSLLNAAIPNHPALADTSTCDQQPMDFSDLYACLNDSIKSSQSGSGSSDSDSSIFITKNPISNYKIDNRTEAQIEKDRLQAIKDGVKTEPADPDYVSTPLASPDKK